LLANSAKGDRDHEFGAILSARFVADAISKLFAGQIAWKPAVLCLESVAIRGAFASRELEALELLSS
jgi:hypothetical protein